MAARGLVLGLQVSLAQPPHISVILMDRRIDKAWPSRPTLSDSGIKSKRTRFLAQAPQPPFSVVLTLAWSLACGCPIDEPSELTDRLDGLLATHTANIIYARERTLK